MAATEEPGMQATVQHMLACASANETPFTIYRIKEHLGDDVLLEHVETIWPRGEGTNVELVHAGVDARLEHLPAGKYIAFRVDGRVDFVVEAKVVTT